MEFYTLALVKYKSNCFHYLPYNKTVSGQSVASRCGRMPLNMYEAGGLWMGRGRGWHSRAFSGIWESLIKSIWLVLNNFALAERIKMLNKLMNCGECANTKDSQGVIRCGCGCCVSVCVCECLGACPCRKTEEKCAVKKKSETHRFSRFIVLAREVERT